MSRSNFKQISRILRLLLLAAGTVTAAQADDHGAKGPMVQPLPKYQQECAACHIAYPAGMLPAASWQHMMGSLTKHYGTDASLDEASVREISGWLHANAGTYKRVSEAPPQDRITKSAWFLRKHREGEVPANVWKRASVGSASNCAACHTNAAKGSFSERDIRIPK
ncbi:MAG: cytochrome C [Rhodoferax sp.]|uniref:diheme cytochrome c n=1 Tax=Rhodoferax sp. TaxID=50421 RepID=UPI001822848A|nr:diheme cytochrome c [Rhodoferax sp.]NMM18500.1 cytochrome C [Rhodoferax sp.]